MYIRFVVGRGDEHHRELTGVITESRLLTEEKEVSESEEARVEAAFDWFNDHLPLPPWRSLPWAGVAWFKDDAHEPIAKMWDLVALLREYGVPVRMLRSENPGRILYEDEFQVVVTQWNHL